MYRMAQSVMIVHWSFSYFIDLKINSFLEYNNLNVRKYIQYVIQFNNSLLLYDSLNYI